MKEPADKSTRSKRKKSKLEKSDKPKDKKKVTPKPRATQEIKQSVVVNIGDKVVKPKQRRKKVAKKPTPKDDELTKRPPQVIYPVGSPTFDLVGQIAPPPVAPAVKAPVAPAVKAPAPPVFVDETANQAVADAKKRELKAKSDKEKVAVEVKEEDAELQDVKNDEPAPASPPRTAEPKPEQKKRGPKKGSKNRPKPQAVGTQVTTPDLLPPAEDKETPASQHGLLDIPADNTLPLKRLTSQEIAEMKRGVGRPTGSTNKPQPAPPASPAQPVIGTAEATATGYIPIEGQVLGSGGGFELTRQRDARYPLGKTMVEALETSVQKTRSLAGQPTTTEMMLMGGELSNLTRLEADAMFQVPQVGKSQMVRNVLGVGDVTQTGLGQAEEEDAD